MDVRLKLEAPGEEEAGPQVFSFACGPPSTELSASNLAVNLLMPTADSKRRKKSARVLRVEPTNHAGAGATVVYTGQNFGSRAERFSGQRFVVSVFDPQTGKAVMAPVPHHFILRQHLRGHKAEDSERLDAVDENDSLTYEQRVARKRELVESFGSRKKKRKMRSDMANEVDISAHDTVDSVEAVLRATSAGAAAAEEADGDSLAALRSVMLPPHNAGAQKVEDIYPVHGIVPESEWNETDTSAFVRMSRKPSLVATEGADLPEFICDRIEWLGGPGGKDAATGKARNILPTARCLVHLTYLLRFYLMHMKGGKGRDGPRNLRDDLSPVGCDEYVAERLATTFAERQSRGRYVMTPALQNKLRCHICVLALIASDFEIDYEAATKLARDLSVTVTNFMTFFREVGAKVAGRGKERLVRLSAPLTLPTLRKRAGK